MKPLFIVLFLSFIIGCSSKTAKEKEQEWRYYYDLGMSAYYAKNFSEAIANLNRALKVAPEEPQIYNALGLAYTEVEEYDKAERSFKKALELKKDYSEAWMNLGVMYFKTKHFGKAIEALRKAVEDDLFDKKHIAYYYLAKVYRELGDEEKYINSLKKAASYNPLFIEAQIELGEAYMERGDFKEAEKLYLSLLSNNFETPTIFLNLAKVYYELGNFEKAKEAIKRVLEDAQSTNAQKRQAYDLLSKILIKEQEKLFSQVKPTPPESGGGATVVIKEKPKVLYGIQIAAFSSIDRANVLIEKLQNKGLSDLKVVEEEGIYKVIYGEFASREEAKEELERLKDLHIYGFIVELKGDS